MIRELYQEEKMDFYKIAEAQREEGLPWTEKNVSMVNERIEAMRTELSGDLQYAYEWLNGAKDQVERDSNYDSDQIDAILDGPYENLRNTEMNLRDFHEQVYMVDKGFPGVINGEVRENVLGEDYYYYLKDEQGLTTDKIMELEDAKNPATMKFDEVLAYYERDGKPLSDERLFDVNDRLAVELEHNVKLQFDTIEHAEFLRCDASTIEQDRERAGLRGDEPNILYSEAERLHFGKSSEEILAKADQLESSMKETWDSFYERVKTIDDRGIYIVGALREELGDGYQDYKNAAAARDFNGLPDFSKSMPSFGREMEHEKEKEAEKTTERKLQLPKGLEDLKTTEATKRTAYDFGS